MFVLDAAEQAAVTDTVNAYNALISAEADSLGFAFFDPNPALVQLKTSGDGADLSRPRRSRRRRSAITSRSTACTRLRRRTSMIANAIIDAVNAKYGTSVPHTQ